MKETLINEIVKKLQSCDVVTLMAIRRSLDTILGRVA